MPQLPPEWIAHFKAGPSLRLGSCSASGRPGITKALAADVLPDGRVMVLASRRVGADVLEAIAETGQVALALGLPTNYVTLHVKGRDAQVLPSEPGDEQLLRAHLEAFVKQLAPFGFRREPIEANLARMSEHGVARVCFSVYGAWNQTPGPGAGQPVELLA